MTKHGDGTRAAELTSVAYVLTHYPRVTQTFVAAEIHELRRRGIPVLVAAMNAPGPADRDHPEANDTFVLKGQGPARTASALFRALRTSPVGVVRTLAMALRSAGSDVSTAGRRVAHFVEAVVLWDRCRREGIEHLHAHFGGSPSAVAWLTAELGRAAGAGPTCWSFTVHCASEIHDRGEAIPETKVTSADTVIAVTDHTRSQIQWSIDPTLWSKIEVVRVGVDLEALDFRFEPVRTCPPRVLVVGRVSPAKGHLVLVDAIAALRARGHDVAVDAVGPADGSDAAVTARCRALGVEDLFVLHGEVAPQEVASRLRDAAAFCLPSFDEGLPVSVMEAMAMGVPVVSTYIAGIPELARHDETALVVPASNVDALADALERIVTDEPLRERLATAARRAVERDHDHRSTLDAFVSALERR